jgi:hypothetical protein
MPALQPATIPAAVRVEMKVLRFMASENITTLRRLLIFFQMYFFRSKKVNRGTVS